MTCLKIKMKKQMNMKIKKKLWNDNGKKKLNFTQIFVNSSSIFDFLCKLLLFNNEKKKNIREEKNENIEKTFHSYRNRIEKNCIAATQKSIRAWCTYQVRDNGKTKTEPGHENSKQNKANWVCDWQFLKINFKTTILS